jgi:hypothetical protein
VIPATLTAWELLISLDGDLSNWVEVVLFSQSFTHIISQGWWGWAQLPMGIAVLSKTSQETWHRFFPGLETPGHV